MLGLRITQGNVEINIHFMIFYAIFLFWFRKDEVDPPYTPTKLFMVQRVKNYLRNPYWQKKILTDMGLDNKVIFYIIL